MILEPDSKSGEYVETKTSASVWFTPRAARFEGRSKEAVQVEKVLEAGDVLEAERARVIVKLGQGGQAKLAEGTTLVVGNTFEQLAGNVWYEVNRVIAVRYFGMLAGVEGTTFLIHGGQARPSVAVEHGTVAVAFENTLQRVGPHQKLAVEGGALGEAGEWSDADYVELSSARWDPRESQAGLVLFMSVGAGMVAKGFAPQFRSGALLQLTRHWGAAADLSFAAREGDFRASWSFGARHLLSPWPRRGKAGGLASSSCSTLGIDAVLTEVDSAAGRRERRWGIGAASDVSIPVLDAASVLIQGRAGLLEERALFWSVSAGFDMPLL